MGKLVWFLTVLLIMGIFLSSYVEDKPQLQPTPNSILILENKIAGLESRISKLEQRK